MVRPKETPAAKEQYDAFVMDVAEELSGTAAVYTKLAMRYCEKYPLLNATTIAFTINKFLIYCHATGMLSVCRVDKDSSDKIMHEAVGLLMDRINEYANARIKECGAEETNEGATENE